VNARLPSQKKFPCHQHSLATALRDVISMSRQAPFGRKVPFPTSLVSGAAAFMAVAAVSPAFAQSGSTTCDFGDQACTVTDPGAAQRSGASVGYSNVAFARAWISTPTAATTSSGGRLTNFAVSAPPQDAGTVFTTSPPGTSFANHGADHTNDEPDNGGGLKGGDANGWTLDVQTGVQMNTALSQPLIAVHAVGGNGSPGAQGGSGSKGEPGGSGGASGNIDVTMTGPDDDGTVTALYQQSGDQNASIFDIRAVGGNGGKGNTPGSNDEDGGPGGAPGRAGDISFSALQNGALPNAYNFLYAAKGATAINLYSQGGSGGAGGDSQHSGDTTGIAGTPGADGGNIGAEISLNMRESAGMAINATSRGGSGGDGGNGNSVVLKGYGGAGAEGGDGGAIVVDQLGGSIGMVGSGRATEIQVDVPGSSSSSPVQLETVDAAIFAQSVGGTGGDDGSADGFAAAGGKGGNAGDGNVVSVNLRGAGLYSPTNGYQPYRDDGVIHTSGDNAVGVVASSVGGAGGGTQDVGGAFAKTGGNGGLGGNGGQTYVSLAQSQSLDPANDYALITTDGAQADGVIVQSIGGGGGIGGDVHGGGAIFTIQHGGKGGDGGLGGSAGIDNGYWDGDSFTKGYQIHTLGSNSFGILVESIGGTGGRGGNADGIAAGIGSLVIGGTGGTGGDARDANISNFGIIQTEGDQSVGALAQSVGGGGGAGGSALAITAGSIVSSSTAIGGSGGVGGDGNLADIFNFGQVMTAGANATGLLVQSIGGGGGNGGSSLAELFAANPPTEEIPSVQLDLAIGGKGNAGGVGSTANLYNAGIIATQGPDAFGVFAQSVGGGGGNGGDATAMSQSYIQASLTANVAIGGQSGDGSIGGTVTVANSGLIQTFGRGSVGVFAQSVGGGGGNGGFGETNQGAYQDAEGWSAETSVGIGGKGGTGGDGGDVNVFNYIDDNNLAADRYPNANRNGNGGILTGGVSAAGIFAQSVGGGGGNAADGVGKGGGGKLTVNLALGGAGGAGGQGGDVVADNGHGAIVTAGASSPGIFAQSVGGGGGSGGNATTGSGNDPKSYYPKWLATEGAAAVGNNSATQINQGFWDWKQTVTNYYDDVNKLKDLYDGYQQANAEVAPQPASNGDQDASIKIDIGAGRAGHGGAGGDGGAVSIFNDGWIVTLGAGSYGMFGQSVGGGGGTGGAATAATTNDKPETNRFTAAIGLGGQSGSQGDGGDVFLTNGDENSVNATISTERDLAHGMYALSVGGGGGVGGASMSSTASAPGGLSIVLGADGTSGGSGQTVQLDNDGQITTRGNDAYGMIGQSIGGGGGFASMTGQVFDPTTGIAHSATGALDQAVNLRITNPGEGSDGGDVTVNLHPSGTITTSGTNSYGIMAQSVGGGGGVFIVDTVSSNQASCDLYQSCDNEHVNQNDGGYVNINTDAGSVISTSGAGAAGVVAQAIGGGGASINGLNGVNLLDLSHLHSSVPTRGSTESNWNAGNAGSIAMQINGDITTTGQYAHGVFAQAAANGGGMVGRADGYGFLFFGQQGEGSTCTAFDCPGHITVTVGDGKSVAGDKAKISVSGAHAFGVAGASIFGSAGGNAVHVVVSQNGAIVATGQAAGGVLIAAGEQGILDNYGLIDASQSDNKVAIQGWSDIPVDPSSPNNGYYEFPYTVNNWGTIRGSIRGNGAGSVNGNSPEVTLTNQAGGVLELGPTMDLGDGKLINDGVLEVGNIAAVTQTTIDGDLAQTSGGALRIDADLRGNRADLLTVNGSAAVSGTVYVRPLSVSNRPVTVLTATSGVSLDPSTAQTDDSALFDFPVRVVGNEIHLQAKAGFSDAAAGLGKRRQSVAANLQSLFDGGASMDDGFTALSHVGKGDVAHTLDTLGGSALGAIGSFRYASSRAFVGDLYDGCLTRDGSRCGWTRFQDVDGTQRASADEFGYSANAQILQTGVQYQVADNWYVSGAVGYENGSFHDVSGTARIKGDSMLAGASLRYQHGGVMLSGALDWGYSAYQSNRRILVGDSSATATARPKAWQLGGHLHGEYNVDLGGYTYVKSFADLNLNHVQARQFVEQGASPFNLDVASQGDFAMTGGLGVELGGNMSLDNRWIVRPYVSASLQLNGAADWTTSARFVGQDQSAPFSVITAAPDRLGQFGAGIDLLSSNNIDISVAYGRETGSGYSGEGGVARISYRF